MTTLTISCIGAPDRTTVTEHPDADSARAALVDRFGTDIRYRDEFSGTTGCLNGRIFQASNTWRIG